jgi:hypothetical protein
MVKEKFGWYSLDISVIVYSWNNGLLPPRGPLFHNSLYYFSSSFLSYISHASLLESFNMFPFAGSTLWLITCYSCHLFKSSYTCNDSHLLTWYSLQCFPDISVLWVPFQVNTVSQNKAMVVPEKKISSFPSYLVSVQIRADMEQGHCLCHVPST